MELNRQTALPKPKFGETCNGCGYCCSVEPCKLAQEYLHSTKGPCMALEMHEGTARCGFVRNPLAYLFKAVHPDADVPVLDAPPAIEHGYQLSVRFATVLGFGKGCDADDDEDTAAWSAGSSATQS